ncbi:hypothetical protein WJX74_007869 [Apatococcus lobatus]|uniref:Intradiol ring-cleavage dioxygenases domain-containing protein n=1 Tax=Apatococcus lobatus TaxID=904363 RepID=A0AAW1RGK7_9CHLO
MMPPSAAGMKQKHASSVRARADQLHSEIARTRQTEATTTPRGGEVSSPSAESCRDMDTTHYVPVEDPLDEGNCFQTGGLTRWFHQNSRGLVVGGATAAAVLAMAAIFSVMAFQPGTAPLTASSEIGRCALTPERMEGPFYLKEELFRSEITENQPGLPLSLRINVTDPDLNPLRNAFVDIWQCNSTGFYSGFTADTGGGPGGHGKHGHGHDHGHGKGKHGHGHGKGEHGHDHGKGKGKHGHGHGGGKGRHGPPHTDDLTFLRGTLLTDESGIVEFNTTVPGWYPGRAPHIHMKVHVPNDDGTHDTEAGEYADSHVSHTGQVFFSEAIYSQIEALEPYTRDVHHRVHLEDDHDYHDDPTAVLPMTQLDAQVMQNGFAASVIIIVDPALTPPIKPVFWEKAASPLPRWLRFWQ